MVSKVFVIGMGMGNPGTLTLAARDAIETSELLIGAQRMLDSFKDHAAEKVVAIAPNDIAETLRNSNAHTASVLLSGDIGFYSGATGVYPLLEGFEVEAIPGISSLGYFCAKLHTTWQDACLVSAHGRKHNAIGAIQSHAKTFLLTGGETKVATICHDLVERGLGSCMVHVGERLSYPDERIISGTADELLTHSFDELAVMLVENPTPLKRDLASPSLPDEAFTRGSAPMTKEEVRQLAICKLRIRSDDVVWDIGAGTGSVSIEAAHAAHEGCVYAIEKDAAALELLQQNKDAFALPNMHIVAGSAPDALAGLATPERVFIGGTSGSLEAILRTVFTANPHARVCISAITLETLSEALRCIQELQLADTDIVQLSVAKARELGSYHMMMGANPIYLISGNGPGSNAQELSGTEHHA